MILDSKIDINKKNINAETPLHSAAGAGRKLTVEFLIEQGANVNSKDRQAQFYFFKLN